MKLTGYNLPSTTTLYTQVFETVLGFRNRICQKPQIKFSNSFFIFQTSGFCQRGNDREEAPCYVNICNEVLRASENQKMAKKAILGIKKTKQQHNRKFFSKAFKRSVGTGDMAAYDVQDPNYDIVDKVNYIFLKFGRKKEHN